MDGNLQVEGDFLTMLNTVLKYKSKFPTDFKGLPKIFSNLTSQKKQKEEVSYHYDLGNDFYSLWLDDTMSYSCGYFKRSCSLRPTTRISSFARSFRSFGVYSLWISIGSQIISCTVWLGSRDEYGS